LLLKATKTAEMDISVVIPTCNRKTRLLSLLQNLNNSILRVKEAIIVDSGEDRLNDVDIAAFPDLAIKYIFSERSVCIQRNKGIVAALSEWIFLCDDDIEVPDDYLKKIEQHIKEHPEAGAVSGSILQKENNKWVAHYIERSAFKLFWRYFFQLGYWGTIECADNFFTRKIRKSYQREKNHLSKAGWPVLTHFSGKYFTTPVFGLGASVIKKDWLINSPYDEVLDSHGIGDHYGVAAEFPGVIHVVTDAFVYHHQEKINRLETSLQYYRRVLALDYFISKGKALGRIKKRWLAWSLFGNFIQAVFSLNTTMLKATFKSLYAVSFGINPYTEADKKKLKTIEPKL
jgi:glycosyltransferase involved in cell wall biosynthesis